MTATYPRRTDTKYRGVIYGFDLLDHETGLKVRDDYVGKTRQRGRKRELQHRGDKPWEDLIVGSSHVLWEGICDEDELDRREREFIREKRPRMNDKENRWNRDRIDYDTQVRQRHERDDLNGGPRWVPLEQRQRDSLLDWDEQPPAPARRPASPPQPWPLWKKHLVGWAIGWLVTTVAGWIVLVMQWDFTVWWHPLAGAASAMPGSILAVIAAWTLIRLLAWLLTDDSAPKKKRRRKVRR